MTKSAGDQVVEQLMAAIEARVKPKAKPEVKVVAETAVEPQSVRVGLARSLGDTLARIDPAMPEGARFARAVRIDTEALYWREVDRLMNAPGPGVTVRFEYHPLQAFDESVPEFNRRKG